MGAFNREQDKFVSDQKEKTKGAEAAVPPWIGYNEEEAMKSQILSLSEVQYTDARTQTWSNAL